MDPDTLSELVGSPGAFALDRISLARLRRPRIDGIEVTQGIQYSRLAAT